MSTIRISTMKGYITAKNLHFLWVVLVFILYIFNSYYAVDIFGPYWSSLYLLIIASFLPVFFLIKGKTVPTFTDTSVPDSKILLLGAVGLVALMPSIGQAIGRLPLENVNSDVLHQLEAQFDRFMRGEQPYKPLEQFEWRPFPVYMPMHWLPIGIGRWLHIDVRWGGVLIFAIIYLVILYQLSLKPSLPKGMQYIAYLLPLLILFAPIQHRSTDITQVFEVLIAGYYLLLGFGLYKKNDTLIIIALICIMMSRYTLVFWLPLFMILLYKNYGWKKCRQYIVWGASAFMILFVLPFWLRDPSILMKGIRYHNGCFGFDYDVLVETGELSYMMYSGTTFMHIAHTWWGIDNWSEAFSMIRLFQLFCMTLLTIGALWYYKKVRARIDMYDYLLAVACLFLAIFYLTAPFGYAYYWFSFSALVWFVLLRILDSINQGKDSE